MIRQHVRIQIELTSAIIDTLVLYALSNSTRGGVAVLFRAIALLIVAISLFLGTGHAGAQEIPGAMTYQGRLTDTSGQPVPDGSYQFQFKLYAVPTDGTPFWTSDVQNVTTSGGVFTTQLTIGSMDLIGRTDIWLEVWAGSPLSALSPRSKINAVPFAFRAADLSLPYSGSYSTSGTAFSIINPVGTGLSVQSYGASPALRVVGGSGFAGDFTGNLKVSGMAQVGVGSASVTKKLTVGPGGLQLLGGGHSGYYEPQSMIADYDTNTQRTRFWSIGSGSTRGSYEFHTRDVNGNDDIAMSISKSSVITTGQITASGKNLNTSSMQKPEFIIYEDRADGLYKAVRTSDGAITHSSSNDAAAVINAVLNDYGSALYYSVSNPNANFTEGRLIQMKEGFYTVRQTLVIPPNQDFVFDAGLSLIWDQIPGGGDVV